MKIGIPIVGSDLRTWAEDMRRFLGRTWNTLTFKDAASAASEDGLIMWDATGYPVVSKGGEWRQVVLASGYAVLRNTGDVTAAVANTAYEIPLSIAGGAGLSVSGGTDVVFNEGGVYLLAFSAQITSSSASTVTFRFWPRVNGVDASGSTILATLHENDASTVVSRTILSSFSPNDTLTVAWAVSSTNGSLRAEPATAYAPASPSVTLSVTRLRE